MVSLGLAVVAVCLVQVNGYSSFIAQLPNGDKVPDPCNPQEMWMGVGHMAKQGMGPRNQFGLDFKANGLSWQSVCNMDSDGDGLTNGQELGDPSCTWSPGMTPSRTTDISHPGFCDPIGSAACNSNPNKLSCEAKTFDCPAIEEPGVMSRLLQFPRTTIPATETNYYCMTFDLDVSRDYHMIAHAIQLDNVNVMHHALLYGCNDDAESIPQPRSCGMATQSCQDVIGLWTVGLQGECMYREAGFRIGQTGYKRVLLEFHWNNPDLMSGMTDASGLTIYYTPNLRTYDAGVFWTGQTYLEIPPNSDRHVEESTCPSECTKRLIKDTIYFTQGLNHMHYKGKALSVEKISEDKSSRIWLTNEQDYSYDSPKVHTYDPPVAVHPGDTLHTTCVFHTHGATKTIKWGEGTNDEMCFGFFTYYPKRNAPDNQCLSYRSYEPCRNVNGTYGDCAFNDYFDLSNPVTKALTDNVLDSCNHYYGCRQECPAAIAEALKHPCLSPDKKEWALAFKADSQDIRQVRWAHAMMSCDDDMSGPVTWPTAGAASVVKSTICIFTVLSLGRLFL